jgi:hypothetical protein
MHTCNFFSSFLLDTGISFLVVGTIAYIRGSSLRQKQRQRTGKINSHREEETEEYGTATTTAEVENFTDP